MRNASFFFLVLLTAVTIAQKPFTSFEHDLGSGKKVTQLFTAVFPEKDEVLLFVEDKKTIAVYPYNKKGQKMREGFSFPNFAKKYPNIGGYLAQDGKYVLFLSTLNKKKWAIITLDFATKSFDLQETNLEVIGRYTLESLTYKEEHYVFSIKPNSSIIEAHVINTSGAIRTQTYSFEAFEFGTENRTIPNLDKLIESTYTREAATIDNDSPSSLESSKSRTKFYQDQSHITLTIDGLKTDTFYLEFDLENETSSAQKISKTAFDKELQGASSNSYIYDNKLFIFKASSTEMDFSIYSLDTFEKLKSFSAVKGTPISFKNTPIIQNGGEFDSYRELEKTSKFLRKVALSNPAIAVFKKEGKYVITLGATKEITQGGPMVFAYGGGLAGAVVGGLVSGIANSTYYQYNAYTYTKSAHFKMVLDEALNFIPETEIPLNSFDDISDFTQHTNIEVIQTVFKFPEFYVWGALNSKNNRINFFKF